MQKNPIWTPCQGYHRNMHFATGLKHVKTYYKQPNKHLLKMNVNLTAKASKVTLKYIELTLSNGVQKLGILMGVCIMELSN